MKRKLLLSLILVAVLALPFYSGCTSDTSTVYKLTINDHNPAPTGPAKAVDIWASYVEEQSNGRIDIEVIHGAALFTGDEIYGQLSQNGCDGGVYVIREEDGFLLSEVVTLPFLGFKEQHFEGMWDTLWDEYPDFEKEWDDVTVLGVMIMPGTQFSFVDKVVNTPADIKGVKMFCAEKSLADIMNAVGGVGVQQPITDMAPSVQTGLVEGVFNHYPVCNVFGALPLMHSHTEFGGGVNFTPMFLLMSNGAMKKLPSDLRKIVQDSGSYWVQEFMKLDNADIAAAKETTKDDKFVKLNSDQIAEWRNMSKATLIDTWIKKCEDKGLPGQKVYDRLMELISKS